MGLREFLFGRGSGAEPRGGGDVTSRATPPDATPLLREIVEHVSIVIGDESQKGRLRRLEAMGPDVVPQIDAAVAAVVRGGSSLSEFENAGLLCEAMGAIGGPDAFERLSRFATQDSNVYEYRFVREGATRGLSRLQDEPAGTA